MVPDEKEVCAQSRDSRAAEGHAPPPSFCCLCIKRGEVLTPKAWLAGRRKKRGFRYKVAMKYYELNDSAGQRSTKKNQLANKNSSQLAKCFHTDPPEHLRRDGQSAGSLAPSCLHIHVALTTAAFMLRFHATLLCGAGL